MYAKRGQAAGAAVLLAIIVGMIIFFIILLPPEERAELLDEELDGEETPTGVKEMLLKESPGRISYVGEKSIEKVIPPSHIFTKTGPIILAEREYLTVKKSVFSSQIEEVYFDIEDISYTENVLLDFVIDAYQGRLIVLLNGREIFNRETNKIKPLKLPKSLIDSENTLTFKVSSPGIAFWRTNQYDLKNIKIVADVIDITAQKSKHFFHIGSDEFRNIEEASLRFSLSCLPKVEGKLEVKINDHLIFSGVPENCEDIFRYDLPLDIMEAGNNWLSFRIEEGDYEIHHTAVKLELARPPHPLYDFELDEKYFADEELKEEYDVILALEFADGERKEAEVYVNGHKISFDTHKVEFSRNIDSYVESGTNTIKIIPQTSFDIRELTVELKD